MDRGGFDIVIGNPPYIRQEQLSEFKPLWQKDFACYDGVADIYVYFFERGLQLLKEGGLLAYISSNKYFRSGYGKKLREFLSTKTTIEQIIDFGDAPVFDATTYPSIIVLRKSPPSQNNTRIFIWNPGEKIEKFSSVVTHNGTVINQSELSLDGWQLTSPAVLRLLEKLRKAGKPLREYVGSRFYWGIKTGLNEAFIVDRVTRDRLIAEHPSSADILKPYLRGRDIKRWTINFAEQYILFIPWHFPLHKDKTISGASEEAEYEFRKKYPAIYNYLIPFKKQLESRNKDETGIRYEWYALQRCAATYWEEIERPKIIYPDIAVRCQFAFDQTNSYPDATLFFIPDGSLYLLGILNSAVDKFFFPQICPTIRGGFMRFKSIYVEQIPIPVTTKPEAIEALVNKILLTKSKDPLANVSKLEHQIDQLVYQLYDLTPEEINLIESQTGS